MAVDRALRLQVADEIARLMRGEQTATQHREISEARFKSHENSDDAFALTTLATRAEYDFNTASDISLRCSHHYWERLRRTLAFLESDLEHVQIPGTCTRLNITVRLLLAVGMTTACIVLIWMSLDLGWRFLALGWIGVGLAYLAGGILVGTLGPFRSEQERQARLFYPFNDEQQWRAHEDRLIRFGLPSYNAAVHNRPISRPKRELGRLMVDAVLALIFAMIAIAFLLMTAIHLPITAMFWLFETPSPRVIAVPAANDTVRAANGRP